MTALATLTFTASFFAAVYAIATTVAPKWSRIGDALRGRVLTREVG